MTGVDSQSGHYSIQLKISGQSVIYLGHKSFGALKLGEIHQMHNLERTLFADVP